MSEEIVLRVEGLMTQFKTDYGIVKAVDGLSFELKRGETLGIVGESGSGKSVTNLSIMRLIQSPPGKTVGGKVIYQGKDLLQESEEDVRVLRGKDISMIFQDPLTSLNPVLTISLQIAEALQLHQGLKKREAKAKAVEMLKLIGIPDPERRAGEYPHQLSGGMRQRVMIAHCPLLQSRDPHRGRADDGPRRHDSGPDPRPHQESLGSESHGGHHDHPRPRRGGGYVRFHLRDVRRAYRRARLGGRSLLRSQALPTPVASSTPFPASIESGPMDRMVRSACILSRALRPA